MDKGHQDSLTDGKQAPPEDIEQQETGTVFNKQKTGSTRRHRTAGNRDSL